MSYLDVIRDLVFENGDVNIDPGGRLQQRHHPGAASPFSDSITLLTFGEPGGINENSKIPIVEFVYNYFTIDETTNDTNTAFNRFNTLLPLIIKFLFINPNV